MKKFVKISLGAALIGATLASTALAGKILHRGNNAETGTIDPHFANGVWEDAIIGDMFMGLTTTDSKGKVIPGLAKSWKSSADGLTWTFNLRDAVWSDGKSISAQDFVFSFKRILDPKTSAGYAFVMYPIKNAKAINAGKMDKDTLGVKALDDKTFQVTLEAPTPYFLELMAFYTSWAVPKHVVQKHGKSWTNKDTLVVSSAFTLDEWIPNSKLTLKRNPKFYDASTVKLDGVAFYPISAASTAFRRFKAGELHTSSISGTIPEAKQAVGADQIRVTPYLGAYYWSINATVKKLSDVRVREALSLAIDRNVITDKVLQASGRVPAYTKVPPGINNYNVGAAELKFKNMSMSDRIAKAKKLMAQAGYSSSKPLVLDVTHTTSEANKKMAVAIAAMWKQIHVKANISNRESKVHYAEMQKGTHEVGSAGWIGDYNDPTTFMDLFRKGAATYGPYYNAKFDAQLDKAAKITTDLKARAKALAVAEQIFLDDYTTIPLWYYVKIQAVSNKLTGWDNNILNVHRSRWVDIK